jgi:hypothetical protein
MKKILGITAATMVVLVLIGSFVVYPAVAAGAARDQIIDGIAAIANAADVKVSDVTVDVDGGNGISAATGGDKVGDVSIRIGRIELEDGATSGAMPALTPDALKESANGARQVLDAIEQVGSVKLVVGDVVSGSDKLPLSDSSFEFSDDTWELALSVPQAAVDELLKPLGVKLEVAAAGNTVNGSIGLEGLPTEKFKFTAQPSKDGREIAFTLDGQKGTQRVSRDDDYTVTTLNFSTDNARYTVTVGGSYDSESLRRQIEADLAKAERGGA